LLFYPVQEESTREYGTQMGETVNICNVLVGKPKLGVCNIKMDIKDLIRDGMDWVILAMDKEGGGHAVATNRKVSGSIPDGVFGIFY
jgi:hypothetical protein